GRRAEAARKRAIQEAMEYTANEAFQPAAQRRMQATTA
ncbi:putrescine ABC transporter permease PotI, partial [Pseudomonas sp. RW409]